MTERERLAMEDMRRLVWREQRGLCWKCRKPVMVTDMQLAHRIPQDKAMLRRYGSEVLHHRANLRGACSLECNDAASLRNHPVEEAELVERIRLDLEMPVVEREED